MENSVLPISLLPMKRAIMDSITMIATSTADKNTLFFKSPFLNAEIEELQLDTPSLTRSLPLQPSHLPQPAAAAAAAAFKSFRDSPILVKFIPELKSLEPISFRYDTVNDYLMMNP
jgi:hypothetical protein